MEGMETPTVVATPPPVVEATPPMPMPTPTPPTQSMGGGGIVDTIKNLNPVEIIFAILGAAALMSTIYYYRYAVKIKKVTTTEMQNKVDELDMKIADLNSVIESKNQVRTDGGFATTGFAAAA